MYVLLIHQSFVSLDEPGGTRHYELACYLASRGHQVTVIASRVSYLTGTKDHGDSKPVEETIKFSKEGQETGRITVQRAYTYPALHHSFAHRVLAFLSFMGSSFLAGLKVRHVDVVWGTSPPIFQGVTAWMLARMKGASFLFEVRDLWPAFAVEVGVLRHPILVRASEWLESFLYRHADQVVVNSPGFIDHVLNRGAHRVDLVPNGADTAMFDPDEDGISFRQAHHLEGKYVALYAGAHGLSNDLGTVLDAAKYLQDQPHIAFVLVGDGKEKPSLMARAAELGLSNLQFISPMPKVEMPIALAAADACIAILKPIPLYATVYPNKVFDYMAAGRPVILAIDGVIRQVVEQAEAGIFVPPGDARSLAEAIQRLASDKMLSRQLGARGRRLVEDHFDRAILADRLNRIIENLA